MKLTAKQQETMDRLAPYAGKRVLVLTSVYDANVAEKARQEAIGIGFSSPALRGLAAKGLIKLEPMWKGAYVTVLAANA